MKTEDINKQQFRIIAVRPLKDCAPHIRKVLKEDTTYFFYNDYEESSTDKEKIISKKGSKIPRNFFCTSPLISISAIVGK